MSDARNAPGGRRGADPWWGSVLEEPPAAADRATHAAGARARSKLHESARGRRAAASPLVRLLRRARHRLASSSRVRRLGVRLAILLVALLALGCSVGVITLNNLVIRRSAELGRLEDQRRVLRTENAMMASELASLSAPPRIARLARKRLGMSRPDEMARFIWLDPANRPITARERARARRKAARREAAAAAASKTGASSGKEDPAAEPAR